MPRDAFVQGVLVPFETCQQTVVNLDEQIAVLKHRLDANLEASRLYGEQIAGLESQIKDWQEKEAILQDERRRLTEERDREDWWSTLKNYGLVITITAAIVGAFL